MSKKETNRSAGFGTIGVVLIAVVVALVGLIAWRVYDASKTKTTNSTAGQSSSNSEANAGSNAGQAAPAKPMFKIPELKAEFEIKGGITPLYTLHDTSFGGIAYTSIDLSTQQLVDKASACHFDPKGTGNTNHALTSVLIFDNATDALNLEKQVGNSHLQMSDITSANGYIQVGQKVYAVPDGILAGGGQCSGDPAFETGQWNSLHDSLLTLIAY